jgi:hypothetical protein
MQRWPFAILLCFQTLVMGVTTANAQSQQIPITAEASISFPGYPPSSATDGSDTSFWTSGTLAPESRRVGLVRCCREWFRHV